jgi:hypothetical protein
MPNFMPFESFKEACALAPTVRVGPEGIKFRGRIFWDRKLRFRVGQKVKVIFDNSGIGNSLIVLSHRTGSFMASAEEITPAGVKAMSLETMIVLQEAMAEWRKEKKEKR